jgi:chromosome segregation ATPase
MSVPRKTKNLQKEYLSLSRKNRDLVDELKCAAEENETLNRSLTTTKSQLRHKYEEISTMSTKISRKSTNVQPNAVQYIKSLSAKGCSEKDVVE